jgi:hypothetical protein
MSDEFMDWLDWALARKDDRRPCALCGRLTPPGQLTETAVPAMVLDFGVPGLRATDPDPVVVNRMVWVCPACPY